MFTVDSLLEIAAAAETEANTIEDFSARMALQFKSEHALACAEWMQQHGLTEVESIGPFGNKQIEQGQKVRIKKGAFVQGFGTAMKDGKTVERRYTVTVHHVANGYVHSHLDKPVVRNQQVNWAGGGGYWHWTDATNVEVVE